MENEDLEKYPGQACYLIHFDRPYESKRGKKMKVQHYIGWTVSVSNRMKMHRSGKGARLMDIIQKDGITWKVVRLWIGGDRKKELELKKWRNHALHCPVCKEIKKDGNKQD